MVRAWVTNSSTTLEAMINPLNAVCDSGYIPNRLYLLENPVSPNRSSTHSI